MNLQKINYQKELEKLLTRLEKEEKVRAPKMPVLSFLPDLLQNYFKNEKAF